MPALEGRLAHPLHSLCSVLLCLLEHFSSLIAVVREGLEGAGSKVWDTLMFYSLSVALRGDVAWVRVGYAPSRLFTARFRRSVSTEEAVVALRAGNIIPPEDVRVVTEEGATFFHAGKLLEEKVKQVLEEALPR
ncbi:MAG: hypothetical protein QXQ60_02790 [Thermofilum sp.]